MISNTKIDGSFPVNQFKIDGIQCIFRVNRNQNGAGTMLHDRDHLPAKLQADILVKSWKENADFFTEYLYVFFNEAIESTKSSPSLKLANITTVLKQN